MSTSTDTGHTMEVEMLPIGFEETRGARHQHEGVVYHYVENGALYLKNAESEIIATYASGTWNRIARVESKEASA